MDLHLDPNGAHDDDNTIQVARGLAECVRVLNRATYPGVGVTRPSTISGVIWSVRTAIGRLDQLLGQLADRLSEMEATGLCDDRDRAADAGPTVASVREHLGVAGHGANLLAARLGQAHHAAGHLGFRCATHGFGYSAGCSGCTTPTPTRASGGEG